MLEKFMKGNVLDVSRIRTSKGNNAKHFFKEPNNLYNLAEAAKHESVNCIYSRNLINETKFFKILLKEWLYYVKVNGHIIIEFKQNHLLSLGKLMGFIKTMEDKIKVELSFLDKKQNLATVVLKKIKPALHKNDSINRWTFGILTSGTRTEWLEQEIDSIQKLNIPKYEIIISGSYVNTKRHKHLKIIPVKNEHGWITRKKNDVAKKAKYENLVITHDRYVFDKNWFEGMKRYGNYFEMLCCRIKDAEGKRVDDWITFGSKINSPIPETGLLDYRDWDENGYVDGGLYIMKKDVWRKVKWNEKLMWGQGEDLKLTEDMHKAGIISRMNLFSSCKTLAVRGKWPYYLYNNQKLGKLVGRSASGRIRIWIRKIARKYFNLDIMIKKLN
jgi:hypothetical protein